MPALKPSAKYALLALPFIYALAALLWWFVLLKKQNHQLTLLKIEQVNKQYEGRKNQAEFTYALQQVNTENEVKKLTYLTEFIFFLIIIIIGAYFVFRLLKKQDAINTQKENFMMAITHELKTPIAASKLNLETLQKHKNLPEEQRNRLVELAIYENDRLNQITTNILLSSRVDSKAFLANFTPVQVGAFVHTQHQRYMRLYKKHSILYTMPAEDFAILADVFLLEILLNNLVDNAVKYSAAQTTILLKVETIDGYCGIQVIDEGIGIQPNEQAKIFSKFYRIGNELTRKTKGTGLGLYLCNKIVKQHRGQLKLSNNQPKGSTFTALLPFYQTDSET
jgi:two-component system, OmpR family, sensor histidine kinase CiaH